MEKKIRFGVTGLGHIGKRHAEMIRRNPEAELTALCDIRSREDCRVDDAVTPFFHNLNDMLEQQPGIDVINICTPNGLHKPMAIRALEHGKHVVLEKPMALTKADCEAIIYKALQANRQVFVVKQNRYSPPSRWLKEIVDKGILGKIFLVEINCYWNRDTRYYTPGNWHGTADLDGGTLFTQFSHFVDIMYWLFGDITHIQGKFADFSHQDLTAFEDTGTFQFDFVNGGMGSFTYSTSIWDKNFESSITVIGSNGTVKVGGQYMDKLEYCHLKDYEAPALAETGPANDYGAYKGSANNHHYVIQNVIDTLNGKTAPTTNAMEGLKVVEIIERIYQLKS